MQNIAPRSGGVDPTSLPAQTHLIPSSLTKVTALLLVMMSLKFCPNLLTFHHYYCQHHRHNHVLNDHGFVGWLNKTRSENDMHAQLVKTCDTDGNFVSRPHIILLSQTIGEHGPWEGFDIFSQAAQ